MSPRKTRAASPVIPFANPESGVKERATGQGISMIRDVFRIRALQHHDARVMLNGDNANRRIRQAGARCYWRAYPVHEREHVARCRHRRPAPSDLLHIGLTPRVQ
jgi:hypothetical protein